MAAPRGSTVGGKSIGTKGFVGPRLGAQEAADGEEPERREDRHEQQRQIKRRTDIVGVFPKESAIESLVTAVIAEQHDERAVAERRYLSETSMARLRQATPALPAPTARRELLAS